MAPPRQLPELNEDATAEILLRLPPDEPAWLLRAALVCRPWLRLLTDTAFLRRYRAFHGAPPLLGLHHRLQVLDGDPDPRLAPTAAVPAFPHPSDGGGRTRALDCRHGRVLLHMLEDRRVDYLVWDPVTGDRHGLREPGNDWMAYSAAVFCAAAGCDHLDCHGGPFRVVFVGTNDAVDAVWASVYSSETRAWSKPTSIRNGRDVYVQARRGTLNGDEIYFTLSRGTVIVKYDWVKNRLSVLSPPPPDPEVYSGCIALMMMDDGSLGLTGIENSSLYLWSRKVINAKGAAEWVQCRVIELEAMMPMADLSHGAYVVGFAEGLGAIFVEIGGEGGGLFTVELKSGRVRKVGEPGVYYSVLPYMSFYTPVIAVDCQQKRGLTDN
ncbi:hypothetical protein ACP70R_002668 [Stipagrostis hirtigluma subsp. patula]